MLLLYPKCISDKELCADIIGEFGTNPFKIIWIFAQMECITYNRGWFFSPYQVITRETKL